MGVSVDTGGGGGRKSVDVDINLVPFIDMMSCLVAFLLITAVWTNLAQINIKPKGMANQSDVPPPAEPPQNISMLVAGDSIWIGSSPASSATARSPSVSDDATQTDSRWLARPMSAVTRPPVPRLTLPSLP